MALLLLGAIAVKQVRAWLLPHDAILVLGGATSREQFAAELAQRYPDLPVWISSGSNPEYVEWVFSEAGIDSDRLHLDYRAVDTVTNFTTLVDDFRQKGIQKPYVITSDYHMRRARIIGAIVFGSRGIEFQPVAIPSEQTSESWSKAARDAARAILWVTTGNTGAELADYLTDQTH
ncbi:YdcF family protein [Leptolyngbya sp. AN02str]